MFLSAACNKVCGVAKLPEAIMRGFVGSVANTLGSCSGVITRMLQRYLTIEVRLVSDKVLAPFQFPRCFILLSFLQPNVITEGVVAK